MDVTIRVSEKLAEEARARGVSVELYVQEILARRRPEVAAAHGTQTVGAAVDRILELRKGNKLAGLRIKELIHGDRKY